MSTGPVENISELGGVDDYSEGFHNEIGFKISFKKLGRAFKSIVKSPILKQAVTMGASIISNPAIAKQLGIPAEAAAGIKVGMAALGLQEKAQAGDPDAIATVKKALAADSASSVKPFKRPLGTDDAKWLVRLRAL